MYIRWKRFKVPDLVFRDTLGKRNIVESLIDILQAAKAEENIDYKTDLRDYFERIEEMLEKIVEKQVLTVKEVLDSMANFKNQN